MALERKRYLLTTHLAQIEAMVGLPAGVVDTQGYGWRNGGTEWVRGYWLEPQDGSNTGEQPEQHWVLWTCLPHARFGPPMGWETIESWHTQRHSLEQRFQRVSSEETAALLALTTP